MARYSLVSVWFGCAQWTAKGWRWQDGILPANSKPQHDRCPAETVHLLSIIVLWVGAWCSPISFAPLQPMLDPPLRVQLMHGVLERFFGVTGAVIHHCAVWSVDDRARSQSRCAGRWVIQMPLSWTVMATLGLVMWAIFGHIRFCAVQAHGSGQLQKTGPLPRRPWAVSVCGWG